VVVVGLDLDDLAQQAFHFIELAQLFGHHGLVVKQLGFVRRLDQRLRQHLVGQLVLLELAQQATSALSLTLASAGLRSGSLRISWRPSSSLPWLARMEARRVCASARSEEFSILASQLSAAA
jgi:hypothetical protein